MAFILQTNEMSYSGKNCVGEMSVRVLPYGRRPAPRLVDKTLSDVERKETEGEIQLKVLLNQQMDTKLTIQQ